MSDQDNIDWTGLAKVSWDALLFPELGQAWNDLPDFQQEEERDAAKALIAAYEEQQAAKGLLWVRADEYANLLRLWHAVVDAEGALTAIRDIIAATGEPGAKEGK